MTAALDLTDLPFIDGHMHPPYREHPVDLPGYRWPWYEGDRRDTALAADTAAYRWGIRQLAADLGCEPQEQAVFDAVRSRTPAAWLAELVRGDGVTGLVADMGYPPPGETFSPAELAAAGVEVAPLLRIEQRAGVIAAECGGSTSFSTASTLSWRAPVRPGTGA